MKTSLTSFDVYAVVDELRELKGTRLNKVYQVGPQELKVVLNIKDFGRAELVVEAGRRVHLTEYPKPSPKVPTSFAMTLRKHLANAFLEDVYQVDFDRILVLKFQKAGKDFLLVTELFGKGNIILTDGEGRIITLLKRQSFKTRVLAVGEKYQYPPEKRDPFSISPDELVLLVKDSKADLVRTLATTLGLGGLYAEEVCLRAEVDKTKEEIDSEVAEKVIKEIESLKAELENKKPCIVSDGGNPIDVLPFQLKLYWEKDHRFYESFNKALDEYFTPLEIAEVEEEGMAEYKKEIGHLEARLEEQKRTLENYLKKEEDYRRAGEALFIHLGTVDKVLKVLNEAKKRYSWKEILRRLKEGRRNIPEARIIKDILPKEGVVVLELEGIKVRVYLDRPASQTAEEYYAKSKKAREKAKGVKKAIMETEKAIYEVKEKGLRVVKKEEERKPRKRVRKKRKWFEKFRWFFSRDGFLVLGGRDATSNEVLVKRHMSDEDIFVHADIHGAPAVVIKTEGKQLPETTIEDAFNFAAAYSRAWKHGLVAIDVYWVKPVQVSKKAEHGEYLSKGAFVIRGKRNYGKGRVELAIGAVVEDEEGRVIGGPVEAIAKSTRFYVRISPGRLKSKETATAIKEKLLEMAGDEDRRTLAAIPVEEIQTFLPPGGCEVQPSSLRAS